MAAHYLKKSRHGTVYHFRRRVPEDLRPVLNRSYLSISLRTDSLSGAKVKSRRYTRIADDIFERLRRTMNPQTYNNDANTLTTEFLYSFTLPTGATLTLDFDATNPDEVALAERLADQVKGNAGSRSAVLVHQKGLRFEKALPDYLANAQLKASSQRTYRGRLQHALEFFWSGQGHSQHRASRLFKIRSLCQVNRPGFSRHSPAG